MTVGFFNWIFKERFKKFQKQCTKCVERWTCEIIYHFMVWNHSFLCLAENFSVLPFHQFNMSNFIWSLADECKVLQPNSHHFPKRSIANYTLNLHLKTIFSSVQSNYHYYFFLISWLVSHIQYWKEMFTWFYMFFRILFSTLLGLSKYTMYPDLKSVSFYLLHFIIISLWVFRTRDVFFLLLFSI